MKQRHLLPSLLLLLLLGCGGQRHGGAPSFPAGYLDEIDGFRKGRIESLAGEEGWLGLVGLYWLDEGEYSFGAGPDNDIVLADCCSLDEGPPSLGSLLVRGGAVELDPAEDAGLIVDGELATTRILDDDAGDNPTVVTRGSLRMTVIARSGRLALRVRDTLSPSLGSPPVLESFPLDPVWRIEGRFEPYEPPRSLPMPSVMGWEVSESSPGAILLEAAGHSLRLDVLADSRDEPLFLVFGDQTNGDGTYKGGRYLYVDPPGEDGLVVVDFNRAYSPPCAFTSFATCPLPPSQNRLPFRIEAGEKAPAVVGHGAIH